jgi:DNA-binding NarL/FixJ family response regulator
MSSDYRPNQPRFIGGLTKRQLEVLGCVLRGLQHKEIAAHLYISERTVKAHISNTYEQLDIAHNKGALIRWAIASGVVNQVDMAALGRMFLGLESVA